MKNNSIYIYSTYWLEFLLAMTEKEIKARYKHALLGFLWIFLNPLIQMLVIGFVFQFFIPVNVDNYFVFLFAGLLPWTFFSMSLNKAVPSIVYERALIHKAKFPREAIVLSIIFSNAFHFLISLLLFLCMILIVLTLQQLVDIETMITLNFYEIYRWLLLPFLTIWLVLLTSGISLLGASLNVKYRDVSFAIYALLPLWFYATPIIYTLDLLPSSFRVIAYLNPMTGITELYRNIILNTPLTAPAGLLISLSMTIFICIVGFIVFIQESPFFDDWI